MEIDSALWTGRETREQLQWASWFWPFEMRRMSLEMDLLDVQRRHARTRCKPCKGTGKGAYKGRIDYPGGSFQDQWHACKQCDGTGERNDGR